MNILVFDTETTSLGKPFCYNIGYVIINAETKKVYIKRSFVIEQVWHNLALFTSAYYADKRPYYVSEMKARKTKMTKFGYAMRTMQADISRYKVHYGYAYNAPFDEKVFDFNCDWYKVGNPLDTLEILDIRSFAIDKICKTKEYQKFCELNELFTDSGNYSTNAENVYKYVAKDIEFIESHTALQDSEIESDILFYCQSKGSDIIQKFGCPVSVPRKIEKQLKIQRKSEILASFKCNGYQVSRSKDIIYLR